MKNNEQTCSGEYPDLSQLASALLPGTVLVDVETTGLHPSKHSIIEIAGLKPNGEVFTSACRPRIGALVDEDALAVNGTTIDDLEYRQKSWSKAIREFAEFLGSGRQWVMCGWNVNFDLSFLHDAFRILPPHKRPRLAHRVVDLYSLCAWWGDQPAHTSESACRAFGIEVEPDVHRAINGVIWSAQLLSKLQSNKAALFGIGKDLEAIAAIEAAKAKGGQR